MYRQIKYASVVTFVKLVLLRDPTFRRTSVMYIFVFIFNVRRFVILIR